MGIAQTGTGKTLAFAVPMIQRLTDIKGRGLIIVPTRELALQVDEVFQKFRAYGAGTAVLIGGASMKNQVRSIEHSRALSSPRPDSLIDHIERRTINLGDVRILVLDEADRMLDMGFAPQISKMVQDVPADGRQCFSPQRCRDDNAACVIIYETSRQR